jgi:hypothetical protein
MRPRHKDALPESGLKHAIEHPYKEPPGLDHTQQKVVEECAAFLDKAKLNFLKARLLGGVTGFHDFTSVEVTKTQSVADKHGISL